jgi:hypothetical protein
MTLLLKILVLTVAGVFFVAILGLLVAFPLANLFGFKMFRSRGRRF